VLTRVPARLAAISDATAIVVFVTIGLLSHQGDLSVGGYARDALPFLGCWFAAALAVGLYAHPSLARLALTWAIGVPVAVLVRALVLGRTLGGKEAAFLAVSLVTIGVLVVALRAVLTPLAARRARS
jgi:cytochrome c oxidase subunit IV